MQFIKPGINIDFIGKRKIAFTFSALLLLISIITLIVHGGPKYGIDFSGGTEIQIRFPSPVSTDFVKKGLDKVGLDKAVIQSFGENEYLIRTAEYIGEKKEENAAEKTAGLSTDLTIALSDLSFQITEKDIEKMKNPESEKAEKLTAKVASSLAPLIGVSYAGPDKLARFTEDLERVLGKEDAGKYSAAIYKGSSRPVEKEVEIRRISGVGPQVGKDLREKALFAIFYTLLFITIYISGRFEAEWIKSGIMAGALILSVYGLSGLIHHIPFLIIAALIVTLILFGILRLKYAMGAIVALIHDVMITVGIFSLFDKEFSLPIIAALLTIIGYSLNDTIIVFDRIRENIKKNSKTPLDLNINTSINETLNRTVLTSLTTLVVVVILFLFGGGIIHDFAFALIIGIAIGTYSSVFVASPILLAWESFTGNQKK